MKPRFLSFVCFVFLFFGVHRVLPRPQNGEPIKNIEVQASHYQKIKNVDRVSVAKCKTLFREDESEEMLDEIDVITENSKDNVPDAHTAAERTESSRIADITTENLVVTEEFLTTGKVETTTDGNTEADISNILYNKLNKLIDDNITIPPKKKLISREPATNDNEKEIILVIAGGEDSDLGEFPHMAAIGWKNEDGSYTFDCGGTLISDRFVLTAAHCTYSHGASDPIPAVVRLGDQNIDISIYDQAEPIQVNIKSIYKHPHYTRRKYYNDIALLELEVSVNFSEAIQPACLWSSRDLSYYSSAIATGWGVVDPYTLRRSNELQKVSLEIISNGECNSLLRNNINKKWDKGFLDTQLCAGERKGGKDTCQGDSGSPLQVRSWKNPDTYFVLGITSFGPRFCAQLPAVYTRVSSYLDWIESVVWPEEYNTWLNSSVNTHQNI